VHAAVDTLGHLLALHVTPVDAQEREHVAALAAAVQEATGETVEVAYVDQGYTGADPALDAADYGIRLEVVKLPAARRGFVLVPRRWVVERSLAWARRFRRLARDYERLPETVAGLHFVAFACLMLHRIATLPSISMTRSSRIESRRSSFGYQHQRRQGGPGTTSGPSLHRERRAARFFLTPRATWSPRSGRPFESSSSPLWCHRPQ
jgi:transposase